MPERTYPAKKIPRATIAEVLRRVFEAGRTADRETWASTVGASRPDDFDEYVFDASPYAMPSQSTFTARLRQGGKWESFDTPLPFVNALRTGWEAVSLTYNRSLVNAIYLHLSSDENSSDVSLENGKEVLTGWVFETVEASLETMPLVQATAEATGAIKKGIPTLVKWLGGIVAAVIVAAFTKWLGLI